MEPGERRERSGRPGERATGGGRPVKAQRREMQLLDDVIHSVNHANEKNDLRMTYIGKYARTLY